MKISGVEDSYNLVLEQTKKEQLFLGKELAASTS
jgi:hypothetical protein